VHFCPPSDHDRVEDTGLRPCPLPHHRTYGFPYPAVEPLASLAILAIGPFWQSRSFGKRANRITGRSPPSWLAARVGPRCLFVFLQSRGCLPLPSASASWHRPCGSATVALISSGKYVSICKIQSMLGTLGTHGDASLHRHEGRINRSAPIHRLRQSLRTCITISRRRYDKLFGGLSMPPGEYSVASLPAQPGDYSAAPRQSLHSCRLNIHPPNSFYSTHANVRDF